MDETPSGDGRGHALETAGGEATPAAMADELERARERLAFYESFDRLIQENIARAGELVRETLSLRDGATEELRAARAEVERSLSDERARHQAMLVELRDDLASLRAHLGGLEQRVVAALSTVGERAATPAFTPPAAPAVETGAREEAPVEPARIEEVPVAPPSTASDIGGVDPAMGAAHEPARPAGQEAAPIDVTPPLALASRDVPIASPFEPVFGGLAPDQPSLSAGTSATRAAPEIDAGVEPALGIDETPWMGADVPVPPAPSAVPAGAETLPASAAATVERDRPALSVVRSSVETAAPVPVRDTLGTGEAGPDVAIADQTAPRQTTLLVHGVPRAATALSLQRHIAALPTVQSVEAREFAEGVLRLQVTAAPPLSWPDVERWEGGGPLEALHILDDVIEVRMLGAGR